MEVSQINQSAISKSKHQHGNLTQGKQLVYFDQPDKDQAFKARAGIFLVSFGKLSPTLRFF